MTPMFWLAMGALGLATVVSIGVAIYAAWASRRIDALHLDLRGVAQVADASTAEIKALRDELVVANSQLNEARRAHRAEVEAVNAALKEARDRIAASSTPAGTREGLTRRPPPGSTPLPSILERPALSKTPVPTGATPPTGARAVLPAKDPGGRT